MTEFRIPSQEEFIRLWAIAGLVSAEGERWDRDPTHPGHLAGLRILLEQMKAHLAKMPQL